MALTIGSGITFGSGINLNPPALPSAPTIGTATATGSTTATVAFTAPLNSGSSTITTYTATSSPGNITGTLSQSGSGTITVSGLTASTSYTFTVTATNSVGTSSASSASNSITTNTGVPTTIGEAFGGGYYAGQISTTANGVATHYLIVSPKATGQLSNVTYGPTGTVTGATSAIDGSTNTATLAALGSTYQAAYQCKNLNIGGYTDWYLPSKYELEVLYWYLKPTNTSNWTSISSGANPYAVSPEPSNTSYTSSSPAQTTVSLFQTGNSESIEAAPYNSFMWSSTQYDTNSAWYQYFGTTQPGKQQYEFKNTAGVARAIRKIPV